MKQIYFREKYLRKIRGFYHDTEMIKVITGVRRCGKSTLLKMIAEELLQVGIKKEEKTQYINGTKYLFIDEVQNVKDFERVINSFREEGDFSIFITGSNSYLLSGDLVTKLTGRYIEFPMTTLTFDEYVGMKKFLNLEVNPNSDQELIHYILEGGFPLTLQYQSLEDKRLYVSSVVDEIYDKDIKKNKKIRKKNIFEKVQTYIVNNFGATTSVNALCDYLKKNGDNVSKITVYNYLKILENAKIISKCERFDMKSKKSLNGEEKYYLTDLSFYFVKNTDNRINYGPVLENIVYNYLKSLGYKISIGKIGKLEVDFIIRNLVNDYAYIQVARTIDNDNYDENGKNITEEREYRPLESIPDGYSKYLLTMDRLLQKRSGIKHLNIVDMMLNNEELL